MTRERQLADALTELADTLIDDFDIVDLLHQLTVRCVELLDIDSAGLLLIDQRGHLRPMAASDERTHLLELLQLQNLEGPCLDCFRAGTPVISTDLAADSERWPRFAAAARAAGFEAVLALPMRNRDDIIGALNLLRTAAGTLTDEDLHLGRALANVATIGILHQRALVHQETIAEQVQSALNSRITIEQAKGVLAERLSLDMGAAFDLLQSYAREHHRGISDVALAVIRAELNVADLRQRP